VQATDFDQLRTVGIFAGLVGAVPDGLQIGSAQVTEQSATSEWEASRSIQVVPNPALIRLLAAGVRRAVSRSVPYSPPARLPGIMSVDVCQRPCPFLDLVCHVCVMALVGVVA
jgi:hypothetical protein